MAKGKPEPAGTGVLCNHKGKVVLVFSKHVGAKESNEAEIMALLEALHTFWLHS